MDQPEPLHFERLQIGHSRERSDWRLPWAAHSHGRLLTGEELQIDGTASRAVPDRCLQPVQPSAVWESRKHQHRLQCSEHGWESVVPDRGWNPDNFPGECSFAPEYCSVRGSWYREYLVGSKPGIPVLSPV